MEVTLRMIYSGLFKRFNNFAVIWPSEFFFLLDPKPSLDIQYQEKETELTVQWKWTLGQQKRSERVVNSNIQE